MRTILILIALVGLVMAAAPSAAATKCEIQTDSGKISTDPQEAYSDTYHLRCPVVHLRVSPSDPIE